MLEPDQRVGALFVILKPLCKYYIAAIKERPTHLLESMQKVFKEELKWLLVWRFLRTKIIAYFLSFGKHSNEGSGFGNFLLPHLSASLEKGKGEQLLPCPPSS